MVKDKKSNTAKRKKLNTEEKSRNILLRHKLTFGQKAADKLTTWAGSWTFIFFLVFLMGIWVYLNVTAFINHWDPYPFILLNLFLSCLAAIQAPIILLSQNRAAERDRIRAEYDYSINRKAEREIENMQQDLDQIKSMLRVLKKSRRRL